MINATINIHTESLPRWARWVWAFRNKRRQISIPESWAEVPYKLRIKAISAMMQRGDVSHEALRLLIFRALVPMPSWLFIRIPNITLVEELLPRVDWAQNLPAERFDPYIQIGKTTWCIPEEGLRDLSLGQFFDCERLVSGLRTGADVLEFLSAMLRPATPDTLTYFENTGLLPPASRIARKRYAQQMISIPAEHSFYLLQYYAAQRDQLKKDFPDLYNANEETKKELTDWESLPARIAESGVFGSLEAVLRTPARVYLAWANARVGEQNKQKQQTLQEIIRAHHKKFTA